MSHLEAYQLEKIRLRLRQMKLTSRRLVRGDPIMKTIIRAIAILLMFSGLAKACFAGNDNAYCPWKVDTKFGSPSPSWNGLLLESKTPDADHRKAPVANNYRTKYTLGTKVD